MRPGARERSKHDDERRKANRATTTDRHCVASLASEHSGASCSGRRAGEMVVVSSMPFAADLEDLVRAVGECLERWDVRGARSAAEKARALAMSLGDAA